MQLFFINLAKISDDYYKKKKLKQQIDQFPDTISMDEVIERLIMLEKIETQKARI